MPVVIIPLIASIVASGLMFLVLGGPIASLTKALNGWLSGMTGASAIVLGVILGLMMCFDLGGPVNKVAYAFAVAGLGAATLANQAPWQIMAAVMAAGMVPPLAMALATVLDKKRFSLAERENGKAAWLLGASFISEGAIPFAAADPLRVIPASMLGGAVTGAICMATGVTSKAPHGGIFVFFAIGNFGMFVVSILVGTVVSALAVIAPQAVRRQEAPVETRRTAPDSVLVAAPSHGRADDHRRWRKIRADLLRCGRQPRTDQRHRCGRCPNPSRSRRLGERLAASTTPDEAIAHRGARIDEPSRRAGTAGREALGRGQGGARGDGADGRGPDAGQVGR